jgi:collagenase-like PrtC family protease
MKLIVPTNWDIKLLEKLEGYPIYALYGSLHKSIVGSGRVSFVLPQVSKNKVKEYVEEVHSRGMKFNYLLNAPCLGNIEYNRKTHQKLLSHIEWINNINIDGVTVTIPYLLEIVKEQFPSLEVSVSTIAGVNSVQRAKFFEELGADKITLEFNINRDFALLKEIRKAVSCELILLTNDPCLYWCPFRQYHYNVGAHTATSNDYLHYCTISCSLIRLSHPEEILKARWIRPEDVSVYEKMGFKYFKISGREHTTEWIANVAKAYSLRRYKGNLLDILSGIESKVSSRVNIPDQKRLVKMKPLLKQAPNWSIKAVVSILSKLPVRSRDLCKVLSKVPPDMCKDFFDAFFTSTSLYDNLYVDNSALEGFINFFKKHSCISCDSCGYCEEWAKKVIKINQKNISEYIIKLSALLKRLTRSEFAK